MNIDIQKVLQYEHMLYLKSLPNKSTASSDTKCWLSFVENRISGFLECRPKIPSKCGSSSRSYLSKYSNKSSVPNTYKKKVERMMLD